MQMVGEGKLDHIQWKEDWTSVLLLSMILLTDAFYFHNTCVSLKEEQYFSKKMKWYNSTVNNLVTCF